MLGDNPGLYGKVAETDWWPFIPAVGVVVGLGLVVLFFLTTVMAVRREAPGLWVGLLRAAASGLVATVVLGLSIFGCVVAASQYAARDRQHHDMYVAQVAGWVNGQIGGSIGASDAARLLNGEAFTVLVDGKPGVLSLKQDRLQGVLQLVVGGCDSSTRPSCGSN